MANPVRLFGTAIIVPTGGITLAWTATITNGTTTATLTSVDGADPVLTAGTYSPDGFINHCAKKIRASIYARMVAEAVITTEPANAAAIPFKIGIQSGGLVSGVNQTLLRITCSTTGGALIGGVATTWSNFTLVNTSNLWCYLGFAYPGESRSLTISGGGIDDTGRFQPRWLYVTRNAIQDSGDRATFRGQYSRTLSDETISQYASGMGPVYDRDMSIRTQPQTMAGPPFLVGRFSAFGATRNLLTLQSVDETLFTGISNSYKRTDNLTAGAYLKCGRWWARYRDESPTDTFRCLDVWPTSIVPNVGEPIQVYPEIFAMIEEARRVGLLFVYEPVDSTGLSTFVAKAYCLRANGEILIQHNRTSEGNLYYNQDLLLRLVQNPSLAIP